MFRRPLIALLGAWSLVALPAPATATTNTWTRGWAAAVQLPSQSEWISNWAYAGFGNHSVRQVVRVGAGGSSLRLRLSNVYGTAPLRLAGASIGRSAGGATVRPATMRTVRFGGSASVTIPAGGHMAADPVDLRVRAGEHVTVTLYLKDRTGPATNHNLAVATSYRATGDHTRNAGAAPFAERSTSWYYLASLDVSDRRPAKRETIVAFGDSITDGQAATTDADRRYPDVLAQRLKRAGRSEVVLNSGIGGNRVLNDSACLGESFLNRFRRDALDHPRVRTVITMGGINDIMHGDTAPSTCTTPNPKATSEALINGYRQLIRTAHAEGVKIIGGTIPPFKDSPLFTDHGESVRDAVNEWIRGGGEFDGIVDFDRALADPADTDRLRPAYDSGDRLHPSDAGYRAMAEAVDLAAL
ncbi:SGNH/GDSL hydrolase family protein [Nonomuraea sp. NPDC059023]|uniref:SGNH/GDSL hydrolase family protein n=1 Tax=unclassified Nonomuraea TaxID=2593643 RepID=UPI003678B488